MVWHLIAIASVENGLIYPFGLLEEVRLVSLSLGGAKGEAVMSLLPVAVEINRCAGYLACIPVYLISPME